jgi:hypothetical protein
MNVMSLICPISESYIDENTARLNALFTLALLVVFLFTPYKWIIFLVAIDFLLRRILHGRFSVITQISNFTTVVLALKKVRINAGPKLFAANVGFLLSLLAALFYYTDLYPVAYALAGALALFTVLEGIFNICVACILYPFVTRYLS